MRTHTGKKPNILAGKRVIDFFSIYAEVCQTQIAVQLIRVSVNNLNMQIEASGRKTQVFGL